MKVGQVVACPQHSSMPAPQTQPQIVQEVSPEPVRLEQGTELVPEHQHSEPVQDEPLHPHTLMQ